MSYGDYNEYPPNIIASYSPADNTFRLEHSTGSDALDLFRVLDGKLFAPSVDPIHYEDFRDFSFLTPGLGWRDAAPIGAFHLYDAAQVGSTLYLCGARGPDDTSSAAALLFRSIDGGRSWLASGGTGFRMYWCFALGSKLWTQEGYHNGTSFTADTTFSAYQYLYKGTEVPGGGFAIGISGRSPTNGEAGTLISFDGTTIRTLTSGVYDFTFDGSTLYFLTSSGIRKVTSLTATGITFTNLPITVPAARRALEIADGVAYIAAGSSLYGVRLDGTAYSPGPATVTNELPDSFGRGLAFDGDRLVVGAPDASSTVPLSGEVSVWKAPSTPGGTWQQSATILPPTPDYSGWFGKHVTIRGDLMAVVEAGYDNTPSDRGSAARVHVYQLVEDAWISRAILSVPFAHSAVLDGTTLFVGATIRAHRYLISRDEQNVVTLTAQSSLSALIGAGGPYEPVGRVARAQNRTILGIAGDPSRDGGTGIFTYWRDEEPNSSSSGVTVKGRFGFAIAADGERLAVGAPRNDVAASQAGKVELYRWNGSFSYQAVQTIISPFAETDAGFGSAIAMKGNKMLIGAPGVTRNNVPRAGAVYLYGHNGESWVFLREIPRPAGSIAEFGIEVAIGDDWYAAGSRFSQNSANLADRIAFDSVYTPNLHPTLVQWYTDRGLVSPNDTFDADPDSDGIANITEYACGLNPTASDRRTYAAGDTSGLPLIVKDPAATDGTLLVSYLRPANDPLLGALIEAGPAPDQLKPVLNAPTVSTETIGNLVRTTKRVKPPAGTSNYFARVRYGYP